MTADELTIKNYELIKLREQYQIEAQKLSQQIVQNDSQINELRKKEKAPKLPIEKPK